jgi:DUF1365 family protein
MPETCLYFGNVMHARLRPFRHRFAYGVFSLLVDLDALPDLAKRSKLFGFNKPGLFAFYDRDHGSRDGGPVAGWVRASLARAGLEAAGAKIFALCFPRVLGYVFNPLTVYYCYAADGRLGALLYEVKNTFGDQHGYLIEVPPGRDAAKPVVQRAAKHMYVSPFIDMAQCYRFRVGEPEEKLALLIREDAADGELLVASQTGKRIAWTDANLLRAFVRYPLLTFKVIGAIHWEALRLWIKGAKFHTRPKAPPIEVEIVGQHAQV